MCYCSPHREEQLKQIEEWRIPMLLKYQYKTGIDPQSTLEVEATLFRGTLFLWELTSVKVRNGCWKIWIIPLTKKYLRTAQALFDPFKGTLMAKIVAFRSVPSKPKSTLLSKVVHISYFFRWESLQSCISLSQNTKMKVPSESLLGDQFVNTAISSKLTNELEKFCQAHQDETTLWLPYK